MRGQRIAGDAKYDGVFISELSVLRTKLLALTGAAWGTVFGVEV